MHNTKPIRIYVDMVADLFHAGHVNFLSQAKSLGDQLVVGIHSDDTVAGYKRQPIMNMVERMAVVESCRYVDEVIPNAPLNVTLEYLESLNIDYVCHGDDVNEENLKNWYGEIQKQGRLKLVPYTKNISTTNLLQRCSSTDKSCFVSQPIRVDFIAYHDLQAQAGLSVFESMSQHFDCRWLIGPNQQPTDAQAAILLDHTQHHPHIKKSVNSYQYLFYLHHDLGDIDAYEIEKNRLRDFNIIFVPGDVHYHHAQKILGSTYAQAFQQPTRLILQGGWPKYDKMQIPKEYSELAQKLSNLPYKYTILYAPTWGYTREWEQLLPLFKNLQCNVIIKNHIYVNPGQAYPQGAEVIYESSLRSVQEMEETALAYNLPNIIVAPRKLNICSLFPFVDVLVTDQSSVSIEFLSFGISIETGRFNADPNQLQPQSSLISKDILFKPLKELQEVFASDSSFHNLIEIESQKQHRDSIVNHNIKSSGALIAQLIDRYIAFWQVLENPLKSHSELETLMNQWHQLLVS
ncbi:MULTISPECIES: adenylyltransferase/cytidyltransferase family protein [unclassified Tolypothrix]|uniref:adenylyltransferase/cytidyltransferase family protein n=1 Tax=unclassified Tolypothrix TaxID=2649714 RepID=UPI0005EAB40A|nr:MULTISPECIES: adenylyltransferase/cytidyltransferase family protein [unclassified Tolypothrix]EKF03664.1 cytidyltransferase domain protein [Tolypothrix sp. PCC 7601]MBE9081800.1 adenylyltransferase/cytidyltransferase family protein [Tolypothrix sp. LEGE 11397]UYD36345.1 adenylyltransferase/cytidyltransferase family protein [Tolypothrix sp. PCC 7601]BAY94019.1 putative methylisocitrate lyase [Microchaete diplosiphon NIES-3275]